MKVKCFCFIIVTFLCACASGPLLDDALHDADTSSDEVNAVSDSESSKNNNVDTKFSDTAQISGFDENDLVSTQETDGGDSENAGEMWCTDSDRANESDSLSSDDDTAESYTDSELSTDTGDLNEFDTAIAEADSAGDNVDTAIEDSEGEMKDTAYVIDQDDGESTDTAEDTAEEVDGPNSDSEQLEQGDTDTISYTVDTSMGDSDPDTTSYTIDTATLDTAMVDSDSGINVDDTEADSDTASELCVDGLVINEVDYDVPGTDTSEFIELYNPTDCAVALSTLSVVLVNGYNMSEYRRISLADAPVQRLETGEYLVIHGSELQIDTSVWSIEISTTSFVQNGPDGIAVFDESNGTILDAFSYEGALDVVAIDGWDDGFTLVEGTINTGLTDSADDGISLGRSPNGSDTNDASLDWTLCSVTPGFPNVEALLPLVN